MTNNLLLKLEQNLSQEIVKQLQLAAGIAADHGYKIYLVGGVVRDILLKRTNFDLDLVVEGDAPNLANMLSESIGGQVLVHRQFGTAKLRREEFNIDFTTARAETYTRPGALPSVKPGSIEDDLYRRDFTINSMAISLNATDFGELLDPYNGKRDLKNKLIRILHNKSFIDDATRILRAVRYEQRFDFQIENGTESLLRKDVSMLNTISGDRIRHEIELILKEAYPEKILRRADDLGILKEIHVSIQSNGWIEHAFKHARSITSRPSLALYLSLFLYRSSYKDAEDIITKLKIPKAPATAVRDTLYLKENHPSMAEDELPFSSIYRLLKKRSPTAVKANAIATESDIVRERLNLYLNKLRYVKISLNGDDLKKMGLPTGPQMGEIIKKLYTAKLDQKVKTKKDEEDFVRRWLSNF